MANIPRNSSSEHREKQTDKTPIFGEIKIGDLKYPSYLRQDGTPFTVGGEPIIVIKYEGNIATVIMNLKDISNSIIEVVWENNEPKIVNLNGVEFLCKICDNKVSKVTLKSNKISLPYYLYNYPLEIINQDNIDMLVEEKNELFYSFFYIKKIKTHPDDYSDIFYKKGDRYLPVTFEGIEPLRNFIGVPDVEGMSLWERYSRKLIYWDKEAETFRQVVKGGIVFENVYQNSNCEDYYTINIGDKTIPFSKSLDNPNEPASIEINGKFFLVLYLNKDTSISYITVGSDSYAIKADEPIIINSRTFYKLADSDNYFTDGLDIFHFNINEKNEIKTIEYKDLKYPILNDLSSYDKLAESDSFIRILYINGDVAKEIILMKNPKYNPDEEEKGDKNEETEKQDEFITLKLTPEQSKKYIINTSYKHGIICLSNYTSSPSKNEFYKINSDGTLEFVFKDANNILIKDSVTIEYYDRELRFNKKYTLIRRNGTSSIFEPFNFNGKPCLLAEGKTFGTITHISIENFSEITEQYNGINPEIIGSIIDNRFELGGETLFYNNDGTVNLFNKKFHLTNNKGKLVKSPEKSILKVGDKEILLLVDKNDTMIGYFIGMKTDLDMLDLRYKTKNSKGISESGKREVIKISVDDKEVICNQNYSEFKALRICEIVNEYFYNRYVCNVGNTDKISGKEFMCDGDQMDIQEIYSEEYVLDKKGKLYYRSDFGNELKKVILPEGVDCNNIGTPYVEPVLYNYIPKNEGLGDGRFPLKIVKGEVNPIKKFSSLYRVDIEEFKCTINGEEMIFVNLWDSSDNRIYSYIEKDGKLEPFKIAHKKTFFDENNIRVYINNNNIDVCENIFGRNIILPKIRTFRDEYRHVIIHEQIKTENFTFAKIWNTDKGREYVYPLFDINGETVVIEVPEGYKFEIKNGKMLINGINYGENELKHFYEKFRPEQINTKGVVEKVTGKVENLTQK